MSRIAPFAGLLFDPSIAGSLESVTTPPYDVISPPAEARFLAASPYNIVRIVLARGEPGDEGVEDKYTRAGALLRRWRAQGVVRRDPEPAYYPYEMLFRLNGRRRRVAGLIGQVELEPWGGSIVPHERTMAGPVEDRLRLLRAVRTNLSPIYAVLAGPSAPLQRLLSTTTGDPPLAELVDEEGVTHRMWRASPSARAPRDLARWLAKQDLMIADGHHRYTMALGYAREMREEHGPGPWEQVMMLVVDASDQDVPVLPIHRLVRAATTFADPVTDPPTGADPATSARDLREVLQRVDDEGVTYGIITARDGEIRFAVASLDAAPPTVRALHERVLNGIEPGPDLRFVTDPAEAEQAVRAGRAAAAFLLPPTSAERIRAVIDRGERLPHKSTYFWPKPRTGLVMRPLD